MSYNILVTGGAGFIGSHVVDLLVSKGHHVVVVDDLSTGKRENVNVNAVFYKLDIRDQELRKVFRDENFDYVVHFAAQASVVRSLRDPKHDANVNLLGGINLLECSRDVKGITYASSGGAIYGDPQHIPISEEHPINPLSPYGVAKYAFEKYLEVYHHVHGIKCVSLRLSNVYGPRQDPYGEAGVIAIFAGRMLEGKQPTIFGGGEQTRDFLYVTDAARASISALESDVKIGAFNISTGKETSVNEIFDILKKLTGYRGNAKRVAPIPGEVMRSALKPLLAERKLGWRAEIGLLEGLNMFVDYLKKTQNASTD
jgi:UDP-glucose 4-epimerase